MPRGVPNSSPAGVEESEAVEAPEPVVYTVTAPIVVAHVGGRVQHLYKGDIVPPNIDPESLANLEAVGLVSKG